MDSFQKAGVDGNFPMRSSANKSQGKNSYGLQFYEPNNPCRKISRRIRILQNSFQSPSNQRDPKSRRSCFKDLAITYFPYISASKKDYLCRESYTQLISCSLNDIRKVPNTWPLYLQVIPHPHTEVANEEQCCQSSRAPV